MTIEQLRHDRQHVLLRCISGSQAYGLALSHSDTDIKGVYILPRHDFYGLDPQDQVNSPTNDEMYYEWKKFVSLLLRNNPNLLELLGTPPALVLHRHPLMDQVQPAMFLSRLCYQTFGQYAHTQIKKARGLNKKMLNPMPPERKGLLDFCYVILGQHTIPLPHWLEQHAYRQEDCGLVQLDHARDVYGLFHQSQVTEPLAGIVHGEHSQEVAHSRVPVDVAPLALLSFNQEGYGRHCRDHQAYWSWVTERNEARYAGNQAHGKGYDAKNMMHVFRLLEQAETIARRGTIDIQTRQRDFLLQVREGHFDYDDLLKMADDKIEALKNLYAVSDLPDTPDQRAGESLLVRIREQFYHDQTNPSS